MVGLKLDRKPDVGAAGDAHAPDNFADHLADATADSDHDGNGNGNVREWGRALAAALCVVAALAWTAFLGWLTVPAWLESPPTAAAVAATIAALSPPLILIAVIYVITARGTRADTRRFLQAAAGLRGEQHRLEATLAQVQLQILASQASIAETSDSLMTLGEDTANRMHGVAHMMRSEVDSIGNYTQVLRSSAASARADVAVLLADLPKAHSESRKMVVSLEAAGVTAHEAAGKLDAQLASLTARGREADEIAGGAAQKLAAHLARIESVSGTAGARLTAAAAEMTLAVDGALDHAARASDAARKGMDAQGAAMIALVDQSQAALARTGSDAAAAMAMQIDDAHDRVGAMAALLDAQRATTAALLDTLRGGLDNLDARFGALDEASELRGERLATTLAGLGDHATTLTSAFEHGATTADMLIGRAETLMTALDATTRELDEALPAAFDRLDARADMSHALATRTAPEVARIEAAAGAALDRLMETDALLAKQRTVLDAFASASETQLAASGNAARALTREITTADAAARALAEGTSAQLLDALIRVRETAQTAAARAREAIAQAIPEAAAALSDAARDALARAIAEQVTGQLADLTVAAEHALATANTVSDRLMRHMLTIADTSAAVEVRIAEANAEVQENDRDNFARRVALLIESLNSTAIDVTKVLSNDVTDSAWAAYLRGDRGVFTRRAVRLLDASEAREIVRHYDVDPEFRAHVNRYIHDFEAMLRNTLSTRDGSALSVTLLSSDMGKLYVALAQAIERLRS